MTYIQNIWGNNNSSYINKIRNKLNVDNPSTVEIEKLKKRVAQLEKQIRFFSSRSTVTGLVLTQLAETPKASCRHIGNPYQPIQNIDALSALQAEYTKNSIVNDSNLDGLDKLFNEDDVVSHFTETEFFNLGSMNSSRINKSKDSGVINRIDESEESKQEEPIESKNNSSAKKRVKCRVREMSASSLYFKRIQGVSLQVPLTTRSLF